jgi:predicted GIY-YIG superfamily endonuclease
MEEVIEPTEPKEHGIPVKPWYCYILRNKQNEFRNLTYNGSTNDPNRRLRQHNGEISGGARFTSSTHGGWEIYAIMTGFVDHKNALSCEWRIKHTNGKPGSRPANHRGVLGRIRGLNEIVRLPRWTNQCTIDNHVVKYTVYLAPDVFPYFDMNGIPENIEVISGIPIF